MRMVEILTILAALRRHRFGAALIALQVAVTLAVVSNAVFFIQQQSERMRQPTGIDEANIVSFVNLWTGNPPDVLSRLDTDLAALRALPGVQDAYATDGLPLSGTGFTVSTDVNPEEDPRSVVNAALYPVDDHALRTLNLRLVKGRWFRADEIVRSQDESKSPQNVPVVVITQALASRFFANGNVLGELIYLNGKPVTVIGVVGRLQIQLSWAKGPGDFAEYSVLSPYYWSEARSLYVLRARPGSRDAVLRSAQKKLFELSRARVITYPQTYEEIRANAYRSVRAMCLVLGFVSVVLPVITGLGVFGLTSFWVAQRQRQIGIRRALGACRVDILRYFLTENLMVVSMGVVLGMLCALYANSLLVREFEMMGMPASFLFLGALALVGLGQLSVLWPALRAASVSPASAARAS